MNFKKFKEKFINFIMKKWTAPIVCGICILLIFAMSANSFAKYYTKVQEERAASVAVYSSNVTNDEQFWDKGYTLPAGSNGYYIDSTIDKSNMASGCVRVFMTKDISTASGYLPYVDSSDALANSSCQISVTNKANGKICEVALKYTITIEFPKAMPTGITWYLRGENGEDLNETYTAITYGDDSYYKSGYICSASSFTLAPGVEEVDTYLIVFLERDGFVAANSTDRFYDDIRVSIQTTQITQ